MTSKQRISTRADSKDRHKLKEKVQIKTKFFQIFYEEQKLLTVQIPSDKTVKDLDKLLKSKLKDRFYNYMGLESVRGLQIMDYALQTKSFPLFEFNQNQQFRILLQGQVADLSVPTLNDFIFLKCLGKGGSSNVYLVRHKQNCKMYALKQIDKTYITDFKKMEFILREKKILTEILNKSPFVSKIYATFQSRNHLNFLLKYYPGGEFLFHLQDKRLKQNQTKLYFCQILLAIENLHKQKIIFRDLKPQNILIDFKGNSVLSDFGLCKTNVKRQELTTSYCGSDIYMPPEVKEKIGYNYHADFYTLGALLYEMKTGFPPFYNNMPLKFQGKTSQEVRQLCMKLLEPDLTKRLCDIKTIKSHPWLNDVDWDRIRNKQYQMPIKLNPYHSYIHEQFKEDFFIKEVNQPIFERLFNFFFYLSDNQNGISKCYVDNDFKPKKSVSEINKGTKTISKKKQQQIKDRSKSHKNSVQKFQKALEKQDYHKKRKQASNKKCQKTGVQSKQKSGKKKSKQSSPYIHALKDEKQRLKQKIYTKTQNSQQSDIEQHDKNGNIHRTNPRRTKKIEIKTIKNISNLTGTSGTTAKSPKANMILKINSPLNNPKAN